MNSRDQYAHNKAAQTGVPGGHQPENSSDDATLFGGVIEAFLILVAVIAAIIGFISL